MPFSAKLGMELNWMLSMSNVVNLAPFNDVLPLCPFCGQRPLGFACDHLEAFIEFEDPEEGESRVVYLSPNLQSVLKKIIGAEFKFSIDRDGQPGRDLDHEYYFNVSGELEDSKHLAELSSSIEGALTFQQRMTNKLTRSITFAINAEQYERLKIKNDEIKSFQYVTQGRATNAYQKLCRPLGNGRYCLDLEESETIEFKQSFSRDVRTGQISKELRRAAIKEVCGFLNTNSGDLIIGVRDQDKEIVGIKSDDFKDRDKYSLLIMNQINELCGTTAASLVEIHFVEIVDKTICIVKCKKSNQPIYCKYNGNEPVPFVRYGSSTKQPGYQEWAKFQNEYFGKRFNF